MENVYQNILKMTDYYLGLSERKSDSLLLADRVMLLVTPPPPPTTTITTIANELLSI